MNFLYIFYSFIIEFGLGEYFIIVVRKNDLFFKRWIISLKLNDVIIF